MSAMTATEQLRERLLGHRPTSPTLILWGWLGPLIAMVIGGFLRMWHLGRPHQLVFDETYYVKEGYSYLLHGVELANRSNLKKPDELFTQGTPNVFGTTGEMVVHPPVGKWIIAAGEHIFGIDNSFGWRFGVAVCGTLSILMVGRAAWRLFRSPVLATIASLLLAFDGHHFVHSRTGLLDLFVMFWALAGFCALLIDRDHSREVLARRVGALRHEGGARLERAMLFGPSMGMRPWRWVAGICLGLSCGSKWSGLFFLAAFGLMTIFWDMGARRAAGVRHWWVGAVVLDGLYAVVSMVFTAGAVYLASWAGWFLTSDGYDRTWALSHPATSGKAFGPDSSNFAWLPDSLRSLWQYHIEMYNFSVNLESSHPYQSNPWSWMIQGRPTSFFYEGPKRGHDGCMVAECSKAITSIGTPTLWWGATVAIFILLFMWLLRRDWRAGAILAGFVGGYLPWFHYQARTIFTFYEVAFVPWVVLAVVFVAGMVLGRSSESVRRRQVGAVCVGAFLVLTVALFFFFYPIYTAEVIPRSSWQLRMWFPSWV
jgi:dolichyl-phosphate-mannose--protein O-mannosyl transferase